ncbi:phosphatidylinositol phosphatase PTPRQ [Ixodes scapularis]
MLVLFSSKGPGRIFFFISPRLEDYTLLKTRPSITDVRDTSAIVSWDTTQDVDSYAANYWIQYRKLNESWDKVVSKAYMYSKRLTALQSGGAYEVRVLVIGSDGEVQERGSLTTTFRTLCGRPTSPPRNVKIDNSSADSVLITWENPPRESWLCWSANVTLEVNGTTESFNLTEPGVNATDRFVVPTRPFTELTVRLRLDTPEGTSSQWTRLWTIRSAEDAPSEVRQLQMTRSFARQASFTWLPPATPNGRIRDYGVVYRPLRPVIPCSVIEQAETKLILPMSSQRVNLEELRPYTIYIISVHAVTVKPGPEFSTNFTTEQAGFQMTVLSVEAEPQAMGRSSSALIRSHSRRGDCFTDSKLVWLLAQALASKTAHTL